MNKHIIVLNGRNRGTERLDPAVIYVWMPAGGAPVVKNSLPLVRKFSTM